MNDETLSSKAIIIAIPYLPKVARLLLNQGKNYDALLLEILKCDAFNEDDQCVPTSTHLQKLLKLSHGQFKTQLNHLYEDFLQSMRTPETAYSFGPVLVRFEVHSFSKSAYFYSRINNIPAVGDNLEFPFLRPIFDLAFFHVRSVNHCFENDNQVVYISVRHGSFNLYTHLELDQAKAENRYDWKTDSITAPAATRQNYSNPNRNYWNKHW